MRWERSPQMATTSGTYRGFRIRDRFFGPDKPQMSRAARQKRLQDIIAGSDSVPFVGVTTNGAPEAGLFSLAPTGVSTDPIRKAATHFIGLLDEEQRRQALQPIAGVEWSLWHNG